ncbi:MAG: hypothetical protein ABWZ66_08065 [Pyrinomonadaceae bacterium]
MYKSTNFLRKAYCLLLIFTVLNGSISVLAQKKTTQSVSQPKCSGAWTGTILYTRLQSMSDTKTVERVSMRGEDKREWEMKYDYKAQITVVESPDGNGQSKGIGRVSHNFSSIEKSTAVEKNSCDRGKTWKDMKGEFSSKTETIGKDTVDANVNVGINSDGTYTVSVSIPQITGETSGTETSVFSGQCTKKEGKTLTLPKTPATIDGNSLTSDGKNQLNPSDPNRISGTYRYTWQNVTEIITWNLQKCGAPLRITDLKFEAMKFPNWNDWQEITEQTGTIDGNLVKIKATVLNASGETKFAEVYLKETYKGDKWDGAKPDMPLKDQTFSVRLEPGEEREVEMLWDSSGYAWYDDGRPRLVQRIKAEVWEDYKKTDEMTKNLKVAPKPIVLVHGLWSSWKQFETWQNILTTSHSYDWKAFPVGEKPEKGLLNTGGAFMSATVSNTVSENAAQLKTYINYAQEDRNAWHVDVVAHSTGGLIARNYISQLMPSDSPDGRPQITHLVMLGTPNQGSPCADVMYLVSGLKSLYQATQDFTAGFNRLNAIRKGVKFSALAGNPLPTMCKSIVWNDGFVPVPSALWSVNDNAQSKSIHTDLTGTKDFSDFVKPRLAIGPKGNHNPDIPQMPNQTGENRNAFGSVFVNAAYRSQPVIENTFDENYYKPNFAKAVKLAPKQSMEIEIPVEQALNFGLTFMADASVSATLFNDKGVIVGKNPAKTPEANSWFRSIFVNNAVSAGTWKLKLENTSDKEFEAIIAAWDNAGK